jgi:hypothetical protein
MPRCSWAVTASGSPAEPYSRVSGALAQTPSRCTAALVRGLRHTYATELASSGVNQRLLPRRRRRHRRLNRRNTAPPTSRPLRNGSATEDVVEGDGLEVAAVDDVE